MNDSNNISTSIVLLLTETSAKEKHNSVEPAVFKTTGTVLYGKFDHVTSFTPDTTFDFFTCHVPFIICPRLGPEFHPTENKIKTPFKH